MGRLQTAKTHYKNLRERVYEVLEVAAPGDVFSRVLNLGIILLVVLNVLAFGLSLLDRMQPYQLYLDRFELISVAFFSVEYLLRLWSCLIFTRFGGERIKVMRPVFAQIVRGLNTQVPSADVCDYKTLRCIRRSPSLPEYGSHTTGHRPPRF